MSLRSTANILRSIPASQIVDDYSDFSQSQFNVDGQPVVIAAYNEELDLPATLMSLAFSEQPILPIVAENASNDATAEYASKMGALVVSIDEQSKIAALQAGTDLGLEFSDTVLYTDADTILGKRWSRTLSSKLDDPNDRPVVAYGRVQFSHGESRFVDKARGLNNGLKSGLRQLRGEAPITVGANMGINFAGNLQAVADYMRMNSDLFGGEENAIKDVIVNSGGAALQCLDTRAVVLTRGDRFGSVADCFKMKLGLITRESMYDDMPLEPYTGDNLFSSVVQQPDSVDSIA